MKSWYALLGAAAGLVISDLLRADGLGWMAWPAVSLIAGAALGITLIKRRRR